MTDTAGNKKTSTKKPGEKPNEVVAAAEVAEATGAEWISAEVNGTRFRLRAPSRWSLRALKAFEDQQFGNLLWSFIHDDDLEDVADYPVADLMPAIADAAGFDSPGESGAS